MSAERTGSCLSDEMEYILQYTVRIPLKGVSSMNDHTLFKTPFSKQYWKLAFGEMGILYTLLIAALLTAMRIAIKSLSIPIGPNLNITFGFIINSVGSLIYGPVVALFASAVSDTLGAILFPSGPYFFPFIFEEIAGGVLFALFYYRAKLSTTRIILGRFAVTVVCNLILNPIIMYYYYALVLHPNEEVTYQIFTLPRVIKNLALFPLQAVILVILFNALLPYTNRLNLTHTGVTRLEIKKQDVINILLLTVIAAAAIGLYYLYKAMTAG